MKTSDRIIIVVITLVSFFLGDYLGSVYSLPVSNKAWLKTKRQNRVRAADASPRGAFVGVAIIRAEPRFQERVVRWKEVFGASCWPGPR